MEFESLAPLLWLLLAVPLAAAYMSSLVNRPEWLKAISFALRVAGLALLALALCQPSIHRQSKAAHIVFLLDVSESVDIESALKACGEIRRLAASLKQGDSCSTLMFADGMREATPDEIEATLKKWAYGVSDDKFRGGTKLASSMLASRFLFPAGKAKRIIAFTDGIETDGELPAALSQLKRDGVDVLASRLQGVSKAEAAVSSFTCAATEAYRGEMLRFDTLVSANSDMSAKLRIANNAVVLKEFNLELKRGVTTRVPFEFPAREELGQTWSAELIPERDNFPLNNTSSCAVKVKGGLKVLALHLKPQMMKPFAKAMKEQDVDVELRGKAGLPASVSEMSAFDAIMLADFPATAMTPAQMEALKSYVRDFGGGLLMTGSENSFGLGGYYKTPVEDVLPLVSRYEKEKEQPSMSMVLVIDKSGSMSGEPVALAREAAKAAVDLIGPRDYIGVVAFDGEPYKICDMLPGSSSAEASSAIDSIAAGGGTNMHPAMQLGKEMLSSTPSKIRHMVILTDGQSLPGDFLGLATEMSDLSMTVSTVALGSADRELLSRIADIGRGRYYETTDAASIPRIFAKETIEASRTAIKEEPFNAVKAASPDFLDGVDFTSAPPLLGYVMARARPGARTQLLAESGDPLLATARFGLGSSAAFTSDATPQWASEWIDWRGFGKFWSQLVRAIARSSDSSGLSIAALHRKPLETKLALRASDETGRPRDGVEWDASLILPDDSCAKVDARQTGCGLYEFSFKEPHGQASTLRITDKSSGKVKTVELLKGQPREYLLGAEPDEAFKSLGSPKGKAADGLPPIRTNMPLRSILCALAILLLLAGILLRRI